MAAGLKTKGVAALRDLRKRIVRQHGLQRISRPDHDNLIRMVDELEAYIVKMEENSPDIERMRNLW